MDVKEYKINDKTYTQRPLVLGQIQGLLKLFESVAENLPNVDLTDLTEIKEDLTGKANPGNKAQWTERVNTIKTISLFGDRITDALAIVLCPKDQRLTDRDTEAMKKDLYNCEPETVMEVVTDFFAINRNSPVFGKLKAIIPVNAKRQTGKSKG